MGLITFILVIIGAWVVISNLSEKGMSRTLKDAKTEVQNTFEAIQRNKKDN